MYHRPRAQFASISPSVVMRPVVYSSLCNGICSLVGIQTYFAISGTLDNRFFDRRHLNDVTWCECVAKQTSTCCVHLCIRRNARITCVPWSTERQCRPKLFIRRSAPVRTTDPHRLDPTRFWKTILNRSGSSLRVRTWTWQSLCLRRHEKRLVTMPDQFGARCQLLWTDCGCIG